MIKKLLKNRGVQLALAAILGGILTMLFLQETIIKKREEASRVRQEQLQRSLDASQERLRQAKLEASRQSKKVIIRTKKPDGTVTEIITVETNEQVISEIRESERLKLQEEFKDQISDLEHRVATLSVHKNPKRFTLMGGADPRGFFDNRVYYFGTSYVLWGPLTIGGVVNTSGHIIPMLGVQF